MKRLRILTLIALLLAIITFVVKNRKPSTVPAGKGLLVDKAWLSTNKHPLTSQAAVRPPDQTFLTYPEWFLVFSPAEQADYFKTHTSTTFPYLKHVDQMWGGYGVMYDQIKGNFPFNTGYHVMIWVIAGSTTVEYGIKSFYETVIGRVTDISPNEEMTAEDKFNADYEYSYVKFIEALPWYEYDFNHQLKMLWSSTSFSGPHLLRKLERRYYLTTELLVKSGYGWLIGLGTKSAYETASLQTAVVMDRLPTGLDTTGFMHNIKVLPNGMVLANLPRYAEFNTAVSKLAKNGVGFTEIAGNESAIMLTVLTEKPLNITANYKILFTQPIFTRPGLSRVALVTTVGNLSSLVRTLKLKGVTIEHIYDY
ncbi:hypothetical protein FHW88_002729 [Mucilaginibacter sp. SG538B]|uniref:hypothetical protein n=1 Tax=Mucilaginibacter sp. SG538B TaxID=2587021 RepID=UPI00159D580B|nr:hypothetical protein [Mucilaginibacter sp. SG538B]NVM64440.1 hypothetical protein [Mucilaginibacter sp. SG538B]